ncbi:hypothetical protein [Phytoactinopolyspora mesophila]|uniref:Uncharacterized protein n=1 Tax=Phytoactinopolyspora mesophila TaxID=2650750 RepID=A0A7K3M6F3_9ACTN|nr:hypothetical protein [Phytoactinopolyspora mesophila]NDL58617.1 hypothetical protein [Phytoactinopolyspora mesophila]
MKAESASELIEAVKTITYGSNKGVGLDDILKALVGREAEFGKSLAESSEEQAGALQHIGGQLERIADVLENMGGAKQ